DEPFILPAASKRCMSNGEPAIALCHLNRAYRQTWEEFCMEVAVLHSLPSDASNGAAVEGAKNRVAHAERSYRDNRDRLAQHMLDKKPNGLPRLAGDAGTSPSRKEEMRPTRHVRLERLAYQFWEDGGRRHGNAGADWHRAEASLAARLRLD
ncbi:MAG: DUF2934 domain-containing protein, partial [Bryobacteraceae bacterium]